MKWDNYREGFKNYLKLEKSLASNSINAYLRDIDKVSQYLELNQLNKGPKELSDSDFSNFLHWLFDLGISARSQARILSGIKAFYKYL